MTFQKYSLKTVSRDFRGAIEISDEIDVGALETIKRWNVFWEQCVAINRVFHEYKWVDICVVFIALV